MNQKHIQHMEHGQMRFEECVQISLESILEHISSRNQQNLTSWNDFILNLFEI